MDAKATLIRLMGLKDTDTDEAIANSAATFQREMIDFKNRLEAENTEFSEAAQLANARADEADTKVANMEAEKEKLSNSIKTLTADLAEYDLVKFAGVISNKDEIKAKLISNRAETVGILAGIKVNNTAPGKQPIHNSRTAGQPNAADAGNDHVIDDAGAKKISNRAREMQRSLGMSHSQAFAAAKAEFRRETINA